MSHPIVSFTKRHAAGIAGDIDISLAPLRKQSLKRVREWMGNAEIAFNLGVRSPVSEAAQARWWREYKKDRGKEVYEIRYRGIHIGNVSIDAISLRDGTARLTIFIGEGSYRAKGIGERALRLFLYYLFQYRRFRKIYLLVHAVNIPAIKVYRRVGFRKEGLLKRHEIIEGKELDKYFMSIFGACFLKGK